MVSYGNVSLYGGQNAAAILGGSYLSDWIRLDPYNAYNFHVEIEGLIMGGFTEISGLEGEIQVEDYAEGGLNDYVHQFPTRTTYPSRLVLKQGLTLMDTLYRWYDDVVRGKVKRRNGTIMLLDNQSYPVMWWSFKNAYPVRWEGPAFDSMQSQVAFEVVELVHEGISKPVASYAAAASQVVQQVVGPYPDLPF